VLGAEEKLALAVRSWASTAAVVATAVARVDRKRLGYLGGLLRELGWSKADASTLAQWGYAAWLGHLSMRAPRLTARQVTLVLSRFVPADSRD